MPFVPVGPPDKRVIVRRFRSRHRVVATESAEARCEHVLLALDLVEAFVVTDLADQVGQAVVGADVFGELALVARRLPFGMVAHEQCILVLGVVLEVGVQPVTCLLYTSDAADE